MEEQIEPHTIEEHHQQDESTVSESSDTAILDVTDQERRFLLYLSKVRDQRVLTNRGWKVELAERLNNKGLVSYNVNSGLVRLHERGTVIVRQLQQQGWGEHDAVLTQEEERYLLTFLRNKRGVRPFHKHRYGLGGVKLRRSEWAIVERLEGLGYARINSSKTTITILPKGRQYAEALQQKLEEQELKKRGLLPHSAAASPVDTEPTAPIVSNELSTALVSRIQQRRDSYNAHQQPKTVYEYGLSIASESGTLCKLLQAHASTEGTPPENRGKIRREITVTVATIVAYIEGVCDAVGIDLAAVLQRQESDQVHSTNNNTTVS